MRGGTDLSDQQAAIFEKDGFLIVDDLIDEDTATRLCRSYDRMFRGKFETGILPDEVNWQEGRNSDEFTRQICNGWKGDRTVAATVLRADIGRAVARLAGWPGVRVMQDNVIWKPPGAKSLGYHQDNAYLSWISPPEIVSCWIALDATTATGGTMELVRGSHAWAPGGIEGEFHAPADYRKYMEKAAAAEGVTPDIVPVVVPRCGGSFHHGWTWHGSGPNTGPNPRRSLVVHMMSSEAEYEPAHLGEGTGPIYGRYRKFASREMDENHFPIVWAADGRRTPGIDAYLEGGT